jgi:hypothetical protein
MSTTIKCPEQAGMFVGDAFFGDPEDSGRATHRWEGVQWESIPADVETLCLLLAKARVERDDIRARLDELERENAMLKEIMREAMSALVEAHDCIASWGSYSSHYFQEKHDLEGDMCRALAVANKLRATLEPQQQEPGEA